MMYRLTVHTNDGSYEMWGHSLDEATERFRAEHPESADFTVALYGDWPESMSHNTITAINSFSAPQAARELARRLWQEGVICAD